MNIVQNQWESEFFGRAIYQFNEPICFSEKYMPHLWQALSATIGLVQARVSTSNFECIQHLQQHQFHLVETAVTFTFDLTQEREKVACADYRLATVQDLNRLKKWVGKQFPQTRFRPPYFSLAENQRFYQHWLENAILGQFDDVCLLIEEKGEQKGIVTLRLNQDHAKIGLLAVSPLYQRQGIGKQLLKVAMAFLQADQTQKADYLSVTTQLSNQNAIKLYHSMGASLSQSDYWFYRQFSR